MRRYDLIGRRNGVGLGVVLLLASPTVAEEAPRSRGLSPGDSTWNIRLVELWGRDEDDRQRNLDIYPTFSGGRWPRAIATARRFNTSIHFVEDADVELDGLDVGGRLRITVSPDRWVPDDGQPADLEVEIDGRLRPVDSPERPFALTGKYRAKLGGETREGRIEGGCEATEEGWEDSRWTVVLNPVKAPGEVDRPELELTLGVADDKVHFGRIGMTWRRDAARVVPFDTAGLSYSAGVVRGRFRVPGRAVDVVADPRSTCEIELTAVRIQGLPGAKARLATRLDGEVVDGPRMAYGRGTAQKGAGRLDPSLPPPIWKHDVDLAPWWRPVEGFVAPEPGEHPRLLFRQGDVETLRERARTEEGRAIIARLRRLLDGEDGDSLPEVFNDTPPHNHDRSPDLPPGTYTTWHGAGYGLLYQVTGEKKYADLARRCVEWSFDGKMDRDNRYGWKTPGTTLRAGPILYGIALAYDLSYDAWPDDFRRKVALSIQDYAQTSASSGGGKVITLDLLSGRTGYPPSSNHYGAYLGAGAAVLAILGDPGTDTDTLELRLAEFERALAQLLVYGFGDHGWYSEGHHPSRVSANGGTQAFLTALRNAAGRDYITPRPNAPWITLRWIMEIVPDARGRPHFPHRGTYGGDFFDGKGLSHSGEIANGFGTIEARHRPALLWVWENFVRPARPHYGVNTYPHRAVAALANWPIGEEPVNPEEVLPKAVADTIHGYFASRNRWKDHEDILITNLLGNGQEGYHRVKDAGSVEIWGLGLRSSWKTGFREGDVIAYEAARDGSSVVSIRRRGEVSSLAVDLSGTSGAPALLVGTGPAFEGSGVRRPGEPPGPWLEEREVPAGGRTYHIVTLQRGEPPEVEASGDGVRIGEQTARFDDARIRLGRWDPGAP